MLIINGVKYKLWTPEDEVHDFEPVVIEHIKDIFGKDSIYLGKQKIKTKGGAGSIPDGFVIAFDSANTAHFYIVEIELASHDPYKHGVSQLNKFKKAIENPVTKNQLVGVIYDEITNDSSKEMLIKNKIGRSEIHKFLSDNISLENFEIVIIINEVTEEWGIAFEGSPQTQFVEFKTFKREGAENLKDHAHLFDPVFQPSLDKMKPPMQYQFRNGQQKINQIIAVYNNMKQSMSYQQAVKQVSKDLNIAPQTVADKCCRQMGLSTGEFIEKAVSAIQRGLTADAFIEKAKNKSL